MNALVTGGAGFIGSHLSERLLEQGARVRAIDAFTDFYPRPLKERNLEDLRGRDGYEFVEGDLRELDLGEAARRHHARVSPRRAGRRAPQLGHGVQRLHRPQHRLDAAPARSLREAADRAPRLRVELVGLRR